MNKLLCIWALLGLMACAKPSLQNHHWADWEPYVMATSPESGFALSAESRVSLTFSQPLLSESVNDETIFIVSKTDFADGQADWQDLAEAVLDQEVVSLPYTFYLDDSHRVLEILVKPTATMESGEYVLIITPQLLSEQYVPLNQTHADGSERYFTLIFNLVASSKIEHTDSTGSEEAVAASEESLLQDSTSIEEPGSTEGSEVEASASEILDSEFAINSVIISEIVTDPQQDFNDSAGGNGILFDAHVGDGTLGSTDEYIELYNGSAEAVNLIGYRLEMIDGTVEQQTVSPETWSEVYFSGESEFDVFHPGDFVVLGNPDGAINNTLTINLWDDDGVLIESISIEDANADDIYNEAYSLDFDTGYWQQTLATPGY